MLLIAVTRAGSISQVKPAADANSKMLRVICDVTTHVWKWRFYWAIHIFIYFPHAKKQEVVHRWNLKEGVLHFFTSATNMKHYILRGVFLNPKRVSWSWHTGGDLALFLLFMHDWPVWPESFHWCGLEYEAASAITASLTEAWAGLLTSLGLSWRQLWHGCHASLGDQTQVMEVGGLHESHRLLQREIRNLIWLVLESIKICFSSYSPTQIYCYTMLWK